MCFWHGFSLPLIIQNWWAMQYQERFATTICTITNNNRRFFATFDYHQYNWCFMHSNSFQNVNRIVCIFRLPHISLRLDMCVCFFFSLFACVLFWILYWCICDGSFSRVDTGIGWNKFFRQSKVLHLRPFIISCIRAAYKHIQSIPFHFIYTENQHTIKQSTRAARQNTHNCC